MGDAKASEAVERRKVLLSQAEEARATAARLRKCADAAKE